MKEVAPITRRPVAIELEKTYDEIGIRSFGKGTFEKPTFKGSSLTWERPYWVHTNDIIFSNIKAWEGAVALIDEKDNGKVGSHRYITCVPNQSIILPQYLLYFFTIDAGVEKLNDASPGSADRNRTLSLQKLGKIEVPIPPSVCSAIL